MEITRKFTWNSFFGLELFPTRYLEKPMPPFAPHELTVMPGTLFPQLGEFVKDPNKIYADVYNAGTRNDERISVTKYRQPGVSVEIIVWNKSVVWGVFKETGSSYWFLAHNAVFYWNGLFYEPTNVNIGKDMFAVLFTERVTIV